MREVAAAGANKVGTDASRQAAARAAVSVLVIPCSPKVWTWQNPSESCASPWEGDKVLN